MSKMSELNSEIYEMLINNYTLDYIAQTLHVPLDFIAPLWEEFNSGEKYFKNLLDNDY